LGSSGDVYPFIGLGLELRARGHDVTIAASAAFRAAVERVGLEFVELGTAEEFDAVFGNPNVWHPYLGYPHLFWRVIAPAMRPQYGIIEARRRTDTVVVASTASLGARIAHDKLGVPLLTVHLQPHVLWSEHSSPRIGPLLLGDGVPRWLKRAQYGLVEWLAVGRSIRRQADTFRAELGLAPFRDTREIWHSPQRMIGMFPDWFAPRQPDWPRQLVLTGFPMWEESAEPLPADLERFLGDGEPPLVFTAGTAMMHGADFFAASVEATRLLGRRALLLTRFPRQLPATMPDGVRHVPYAPLGRLLPRCAALIHHGGIGTLARALAAGVPHSSSGP
jgi:UDP:flavonoid glycosyltransferase YjiC (YdhE family)